MKLSELLLELGEYTIKVIRGNPDEISVQSCKLLFRNQTVFSPEVLYFAETEVCPPLPDGENVVLFFESEDCIPEEYLRLPDINLVVPDCGFPAPAVYNQIQEIMIEDPLIVRSSQRLMEALFSNLGLQHIVDVAFEITGHHIYVIDNGFKYLAISRRQTMNDLDSPVLMEENKLGYIADAGVRQIKRSRLDIAIRKGPRPFYYDNLVLGGGTLIDIITIHNVEVGHVMMYESDKPFTHFDRVILSRLVGMISLEMQKNSFYKNNRGVMYSYFLADLLDGNATSYKSISQRLQVLGFTLKEQLSVIVVASLRDHIKSEPHLEIVADQLHWLLVGSMYVIYHGRLVMLISRSGAGITEHEYAEVDKYVEGNSLIAGISNCFDNIQELSLYYKQALKAAELGEKLLHESKVYHYSDLNIMHMFSICEREENLLNFCNPKLLRLLEYDKIKNTEFMQTLYEYLSRSQNSVKAANALNIHKNTLLYRIDKIKKLLDSPLENGDELMQLNISYHILRYLKLLQ